MKRIIIAFLFLISLSAFSQDTSNKAIPDSVLTYPDSVVLKVPASMVPTFISIMSDGDYSHKIYLRLTEIFTDQIGRQYIKKPKK